MQVILARVYEAEYNSEYFETYPATMLMKDILDNYIFRYSKFGEPKVFKDCQALWVNEVCVSLSFEEISNETNIEDFEVQDAEDYYSFIYSGTCSYYDHSYDYI